MPAVAGRPYRGAGRLAFLLAALAAAAAVLSSCAAARTASPGPRGDALVRDLARQGWRLAEPIRRFGPDDLYMEVDGEAELYLPYGFRELQVILLERGPDRETGVRLELFTHDSPLDAYGIYSLRRFPGQEILRIDPVEAIVSDASIDFARGNVYARIVKGSPGAARQDLLDLAQSVSGFVGGPAGPPPETRILAVEGLETGPVVFQRRALLGYEALAPGFEASFSDGGISGRLVLLGGGGKAGAAPAIDNLAGVLPGFERLEGGVVRAELPGGRLWLVSAGGRAAGVAGWLRPDQAEAVLSGLRANLESFARGKPKGP